VVRRVCLFDVLVFGAMLIEIWESVCWSVSDSGEMDLSAHKYLSDCEANLSKLDPIPLPLMEFGVYHILSEVS